MIANHNWTGPFQAYPGTNAPSEPYWGVRDSASHCNLGGKAVDHKVRKNREWGWTIRTTMQQRRWSMGTAFPLN
jgi:hypothetical protein